MKRFWLVLAVLLILAGVGLLWAKQAGITSWEALQGYMQSEQAGQTEQTDGAEEAASVTAEPEKAPRSLRNSDAQGQGSEASLVPDPEKKPDAGTALTPDLQKDPRTAASQAQKEPEARKEADNQAGSTAATEVPDGMKPSAPVSDDEEVHSGTLEKGDTISKLLEDVSGTGSHKYISAAKEVFSMNAFRVGQPYVIVTNNDTGKVTRFEYEIDNQRRLVVEGVEQPVARVEAIEYTVLLSTVEATINDNLFLAVADVGESPQLALNLAKLFGAEINFIRDLQPGDSFSVLLEKRYREGTYRGYGRILAAHFTNKGKTFEAYLFRDGDSAAQYYNRKGENLRKTLLQAPLSFTRVTSRFSHNRKHPILGYTRPHLGVDYGAPTGTPVKAVGDGVVTRRGWAGGYGNQIIIKHSAGLESMYNHLSGYARGLRKGQKVSQGQVIGFVGSTGLSTGPHLDFRIKQNGKFINPAKAINPRGKPVEARNKKAFEAVVAQELAYLKGEKALSSYTPEAIVPPVAAKVEKPEKDLSRNDTKKKKKTKKKNRKKRSQKRD